MRAAAEWEYLPDDWFVHAKYDGESGHRYIDAAVAKIAALEERSSPPCLGDCGPCPGCGMVLGEVDNAHTWKDCAEHLARACATVFEEVVTELNAFLREPLQIPGQSDVTLSEGYRERALARIRALKQKP